jgi:tryptophan 2,3-dioxygenase
MPIHEPVYYSDYLKLEKLLDSQFPKSAELNAECHDETLFIIVHQVYELWFKQIIHEFGSVIAIFNQNKIEEREMHQVITRLERVTKIQSILLDQLSVMETMTPMDFLEFRDLLVPASGFQSVQFREIEIRMGLSTKNRTSVDRDYFLGRLSPKDKSKILKTEDESSLFDLVENWLNRLPFTHKDNFDFWKEFETVVNEMLDQDEQTIKSNIASLPENILKIQNTNLDITRSTFQSILKEDLHNEEIKKGTRRLSQKATLNALFILLYRDEPILSHPFRFLNVLMDIDQNFTTWRYRHALMAHRLLGTKIGTGGSSGHDYLKKAADNNRVYVDILNLSTFLIPRSKLPKLPKDLERNLSFYFTESD